MWKRKQRFATWLTPARAIVSYYLIAVFISVALLRLPVVYRPGVSVSLLDTVFTAVSAVSVTGLTVIDLSETYSVTGVFILLFVLQLGGFGVMSLGTFFWLLLGKKISLKNRQLIMVDQNQMNLAGLVSLIKEIIKLILIIQFIAAIILGFYLINYYDTWSESFYHGLFIAVSATTNAGFDITGASLIPYADDYFIQLMTIVLITVGAIGFPVLIEFKAYVKSKREQSHFRFTLFAKLTTTTFAGLLVFGTIAIFILEKQHFFHDISWHKAFFYSFFQSVSTRSAGLATLDVNELSSPTLLIMSGLMFIGASPSSVGGGIRTTTFAIIMLFLISFAKGQRSIKVFNREVHETDLYKAFAVLALAMGLCFLSIVILSITEGQSLLMIVFEVCSAFGTDGFSMGMTPNLTTVGKWVVILLMFIGRIGLLSFMFMLGGKEKEPPLSYPKERVIIG